MLTSLAIIFLFGLTLGALFNKLKMPALLGMLLTGIVLGPHALNLLDPKILSISNDLRELALVIILMRAGLSLDLSSLKQVGRPAVMMCCVPALFEIAGAIVFGRMIGLSLLDSAIVGAILGAVSPAVVVPRMVKLMDEHRGTAKGIPQMILVGSSADDVFVIVIFTSLLTLARGGQVSGMEFLKIPEAIALGLVLGVLVGCVLAAFFKRVHMRDTTKVLILLGFSFLFLELEEDLKPYVSMSGLLAIMALGSTIYKRKESLALRLSSKFSKLWVGAEVFLFVLIGAMVDVRYAMHAGGAAAVLIVGALVFRMAGVGVCMIKTKLNLKETAFCMIAYTPKATVQAVLGAMPLAAGLPAGMQILTIAVLAILITAPLGAIGIDATEKRFLTQDEPKAA